MSEEGYKPSEEEIQKAEDMMTDEQKLQSDAREEGFEVAQSIKKENYNLDQIEKSEGTFEEKLSIYLGLVKNVKEEMIDIISEKIGFDTSVPNFINRFFKELDKEEQHLVRAIILSLLDVSGGKKEVFLANYEDYGGKGEYDHTREDTKYEKIFKVFKKLGVIFLTSYNKETNRLFVSSKFDR